MPRPGPRRPLVSFKLDQSAIDWIDSLAAERGENRSETMRAMLAFAQRRMPRKYAPRVDRRRADRIAPSLPRPQRDDQPFACQLGHRQPVMVTEATYEHHVKRAHRAEARELGWLK